MIEREASGNNRSGLVGGDDDCRPCVLSSRSTTGSAFLISQAGPVGAFDVDVDGAVETLCGDIDAGEVDLLLASHSTGKWLNLRKILFFVSDAVAVHVVDIGSPITEGQCLAASLGFFDGHEEAQWQRWVPDFAIRRSQTSSGVDFDLADAGWIRILTNRHNRCYSRYVIGADRAGKWPDPEEVRRRRHLTDSARRVDDAFEGAIIIRIQQNQAAGQIQPDLEILATRSNIGCILEADIACDVENAAFSNRVGVECRPLVRKQTIVLIANLESIDLKIVLDSLSSRLTTVRHRGPYRIA